MKREAAEILREALSLPAATRAAMAGQLIQSLETDVDEDAETAWDAELSRRLAEIDSGAVVLVPWAEARRRIAEA